MKTEKFSSVAQKVTARKTKLAVDGKLRSVEELRNTGTARTQEKRTLLERAEKRAEAAGKQAIISHR